MVRAWHERFQRGIRVLRAEGGSAFLAKLKRKVYGSTEFGFLELSLPGLVPRFSLRGKARIERIASLGSEPAEEVVREQIVAHLERQLIVFVAKEAGKIVGVTSFTRSDFHEETLDLKVEVGPLEVYCAAFHVDPAYRRRHVAGALSEGAALYWRDVGLKAMTAFVRLDSRPAVRMLRNIGFHELRRFRRRRILWWLLPAQEIPIATEAGFPRGRKSD